MPIMHEFAYAKPSRLAEAVSLLSGQKQTAILAGGTDLIDLLKENILMPALLVDLKGIGELGEISFTGNALRIGANVTFTELLESDIVRRNFPVIGELAETIASVGIRNRATLAGNICSAVPSMDGGPLLSAFDASVSAVGPGGTRDIPAASFFLAPRRTSLRPGEIVSAVTLPLPPVPYAGCWVKLGRYAGEDLAQVNLLVLALNDGSFRISFGAVAPVPVRAQRIESLLRGRTITPDLLEEGRQMVEQEIAPISDIRASKEYRMHMAKIMLTRGIEAAAARLRGSGPAYGTSVI